jgi:GTPase KRas
MYKKHIHSKQCVLQIRDTGGEFDPHWIEDGEGFILVYSVTSRKSFEYISKIHHQIRQIKNECPLVLVGNKKDENGRQVLPRKGKKLAKQIGCDFFEISAKKHTEAVKPFYRLASLLSSQYRCRAEGPYNRPLMLNRYFGVGRDRDGASLGQEMVEEHVLLLSGEEYENSCVYEVGDEGKE